MRTSNSEKHWPTLGTAAEPDVDAWPMVCDPRRSSCDATRAIFPRMARPLSASRTAPTAISVVPDFPGAGRGG